MTTSYAGCVLAPFSPDQVASLNGYQTSGVMHPFTCRNRSTHQLLVASIAGWRCPTCQYVQDWAFSWMADWAWTSQQLEQRP